MDLQVWTDADWETYQRLIRREYRQGDGYRYAVEMCRVCATEYNDTVDAAAHIEDKHLGLFKGAEMLGVQKGAETDPRVELFGQADVDRYEANQSGINGAGKP